MKPSTLLRILLRFSMSAFLLWYLLSKTEFSEIYTSLRSVDLFWLCMAFLLLNVGKLLTSYRWQILLAAQDIQISLWKLIESLFVGQFFNNFLPTTVGGDTIRAYDTAVYSKKKAQAVMTVVLDRLIGTLALAVLALLALLAGIWVQASVAAFVWLVLAAFFGCVCVFVLVFNSTFAARTNALLQWLKLGKISNKVTKAFRTFEILKDKRHTLVVAFIVSMLLQLNVTLHYYFISLSLGLEVSFFYYCIVIPLSLIILLVPLSINGIGIRESVYVFLLGGLGVTSADAIALSWLAFILLLSHGIIGGILFALRGESVKKIWSKQLDYQVTKG